MRTTWLWALLLPACGGMVGGQEGDRDGLQTAGPSDGVPPIDGDSPTTDGMASEPIGIGGAPRTDGEGGREGWSTGGVAGSGEYLGDDMGGCGSAGLSEEEGSGAWGGVGGTGGGPQGGFAGSPSGGSVDGGFAGCDSDGGCGACPDAYPAHVVAPWQDGSAPTGGTVEEMLASAEAGLIGAWHGNVTTPWMPIYPVHIELRADHTYSASCDVASECCVAFYYGSDVDNDIKRWSLTAVTADGAAEGTLDITFCYPGEACYLPAWQGEIGAVRIDATGNRLRFDFSRSDGYGPVSFDLERD